MSEIHGWFAFPMVNRKFEDLREKNYFNILVQYTFMALIAFKYAQGVPWPKLWTSFSAEEFAEILGWASRFPFTDEFEQWVSKFAKRILSESWKSEVCELKSVLIIAAQKSIDCAV
ncbi:hypothetical protein CEXT_152691 [Caerostris extrusa]|uniref:Uncharacterized protein n=1 Tax=Caerostris extrusa TaxID=172846 RepID=A0AAV4XHF3_CAEEX|nr:hypothetical protein CEXT_152691 [Caerostris extrusa]